MRSPIGSCSGGASVPGVLSRGECQATRDAFSALADNPTQPPANGNSRHCGCLSSMPSISSTGCVALPRHCSDCTRNCSPISEPCTPLTVSPGTCPSSQRVPASLRAAWISAASPAASAASSATSSSKPRQARRCAGATTGDACWLTMGLSEP